MNNKIIKTSELQQFVIKPQQSNPPTMNSRRSNTARMSYRNRTRSSVRKSKRYEHGLKAPPTRGLGRRSTTDEIRLRWLQKLFIPSTNSHIYGRFRLLILDGHGSHLTPKFDRICAENQLFLFACLYILHIYYNYLLLGVLQYLNVYTVVS